MSKYLIIVESPAKARTIGKFLGPDYTVTASMGHVRDLPERDLGFDPAKNFEPQYQISKDKEKIIKALRKAIRPDTTVFLATDEDREGESISWHLVAALGLDDRPVQRIVFHEVTKSAILNALRNPRELDQKLVDAQQARRILDRAVGYELSPLLWRKVKPGLSAGRVQSVAVRIIVDREREIREFEPEEYWRLKAQFPGFEAELAKINGKTAKVPNEDAAQAIETSVRSGTWTVQSVTEKETQRQPPPPFTTSTLQQEASVKLGFSVKHTMSVAQQLYEGNFEIPGYSGGLITYMRTDSVTLSEDSLKQAQQVVTQEFGAKFSLPTPRRFRNRSKNAQEAHEAIRPVDLSKTPTAVRGFLKDEQARLYGLIWRRMVAGQMAAANFARTVVQVEAGVQRECLFEAKGQRILFPGFLRAYVREGEDPGVALGEKDVILPHVEQGQTLSLEGFSTEQLFTKPPARYTEATLVKKLESEGIGRPSTYAPTISTIQERKYVERRDTDKRLQPTDIGEVVNDFLANHFEEIVNLGFTAKIERQFDHIAQGDEDWISMLGGFYFPFHQRVEEKGKSVTRAEASAMRVLGTDPKSGRELSVRMGRFGPMVQIGTKDDEDKPLFASIPAGSNMHELTLEQALDCFALPRTLGQDEAGEEVSVGRGRYGPYVRIQREYHSLPVDEDPMAVTLERALEIIREGRETKAKSLIQDFGEIRVLNGRFGPYIKQGKNNYKIPKGTDPATLDEAACQQIIANAPPPGARRSRGIARRKSA